MDDLELRRYRAAVSELRSANLFTSWINPDKPSLMDRILTSGKPPLYLSFTALFWRFLLISCILFLS